MMFFWFALVAIGGYLIGSLNYSIIFSKVFMHSDVRSSGSGNAGSTNMMRSFGWRAGVITLITDFSKTVVATVGAWAIFTLNCPQWVQPAVALTGLCCCIGHCFPVFFKFKGGKGAATSVGIYAVCCPLAIILGLCAFALVLLTTKIVSLGSLAAALTVVVLSIVFFAGEGNIFVVAALSITMGTIVFAKHKDNIKRLIRGEEKKLTLGGKKNG